MSSEERYPELDALRGIAVVLMVLYHLAFDLSYFYGWNMPVHEGAWKILATASATTFLLLVGICFAISWERTPFYHKYLRRGLLIFTGGMLVSLATWLIVPHAFVKFGILHLIGLSALLQPFFTPFKIWNAALGVLIIILPVVRTVPTLRILIPSLDYYPLIPWFGVILLGTAIGRLLYVPTRSVAPHTCGKLPYPHWLLICGKRSLWIYLVHQPLLLLLLGLIFGIPML